MENINRILIKSFVLFICVALISCSNDGNNEPLIPEREYSEQLNVSYGTNERHKMDVYLPENRTSQTKVVVAIHGGGFFTGVKEDINIPVKKLVENGFAVINMTYRLVDTTGLFQEPIIHQPSDITILQQLQDIRLAIDFALNKSKKWNVSQTKWAMFGHSAGATLALLYTHSDFNNDGQIKAVGNLAGALDFGFTDESEFDLLDPKVVELLYRTIGAEPINENKLAYMAKSPYWVTFNNENPKPTINILPENNNTGGGNVDSEEKYIAYRDLLNNKQVANQYVVVMGSDHGFSQPGKWEEAAKNLSSFFKNQM
ncbi:carboxylesterase family protein [Mariniflexile sp.]|uniref:carboxylesterase family protein n=1 Tax=Mariniflexile sp. TaxID=1979402 RepID=UPI0040471687